MTSIRNGLISQHGNAFIFILRGLGGKPEEIIAKYRALWDAGKYLDFGTKYRVRTGEEEVLLEAWTEINREIYSRWFARLTRAEALRALQLMDCGTEKSATLTILDEPIDDWNFCKLWNYAHPDERPIRLRSSAENTRRAISWLCRVANDKEE